MICNNKKCVFHKGETDCLLPKNENFQITMNDRVISCLNNIKDENDLSAEGKKKLKSVRNMCRTRKVEQSVKDKIAKKRKKMRQRLKQVERCKEESALVENFKKVAEKHGVKKFNTKKALQAYKVVEVEATKEAIVNSVVFVVWYLHTKYGWNQKRLVRYITYAHNYLQHIGNETRTVIQLTDEIKSECDFDYQSLMADFKPLTLKTDTVDEDGMKMIIYKMQTILPVVLYPLYMQFGWRKKRMADIGQTAKFVLMDMMNGRIKKIKDTIRNECKMVFHSDGRIEYLDRRN